MTWISVVPYDAATGRLKTLYDRVKGPDNNVDNIMLAHSLRPHTMEGHMALYKAVLHHPHNRFSKAYLETIGVYVSLINHCHYCVEHHAAGLAAQLGDAGKAAAIRAALEADRPQDCADGKELAGLGYAAKLTRAPTEMTAADVAACRAAGLDDGEILEINQVAAYFNYANRTVLGLGIDTDGDILGLSPNNSADSADWSHRPVKG